MCQDIKNIFVYQKNKNIKFQNQQIKKGKYYNHCFFGYELTIQYENHGIDNQTYEHALNSKIYFIQNWRLTKIFVSWYVLF